MKLAAIDIGTNSIHMIIVEVTGRRSFEVIDREKEMVKLGAGVFASNRLSERAFADGLETIRRYVQLADQRGVDKIITAATSAIREARNGGEFLDALVNQTGIAPEVISGAREARLIFLAVRNAIALQDEKALVLDIGGGSTEVVLGDQEEIYLARSLKLGVLRLLDMFEHSGPVGAEARGVLEAHIRFLAQDALYEARRIGFRRVIGTSGTIRTIGEAAHVGGGGSPLRSVNAEVVPLRDIAAVTDRLLQLPPGERTGIDAIGEKRVDAIHLGGVLLTQLLQLAEVEEITLCEASLREGLILDYLERHAHHIDHLPPARDLRHRSVAQLALKYNVDWEQASHVAALALQLFDQTEELHRLGDYERDLLEYAALLHGSGKYISFQRYHKNSRYIIKHAGLRGFNDEEILLIGHAVRYHRKGRPKKRHGKFKALAKKQRRIVRLLSGMLRLAVNLDRTKNQLVRTIDCEVSNGTLALHLSGADRFELEVWAARQQHKPLAMALGKKIEIET